MQGYTLNKAEQAQWDGLLAELDAAEQALTHAPVPCDAVTYARLRREYTNAHDAATTFADAYSIPFNRTKL